MITVVKNLCFEFEIENQNDHSRRLKSPIKTYEMKTSFENSNTKIIIPNHNILKSIFTIIF